MNRSLVPDKLEHTEYMQIVNAKLRKGYNISAMDFTHDELDDLYATTTSTPDFCVFALAKKYKLTRIDSNG